jgi:hemoglobin-like flavoprotein
MTQRQIELVENSWDFILINTHDMGLIFYNKLFELNPDLRRLFKEDIKSQSQKLVAMITFAVHKLHNFQQIALDVEALGRRHGKYNVDANHYATVAEALLWTLKKGLGKAWDDETSEAWMSLYRILSDIMIKAAEKESV